MDWWAIDTGGGYLTCDGFPLHGTIGQPDASELSWGVYSYNGGVWTAPIDGTKLFLPLVLK